MKDHDGHVNQRALATCNDMLIVPRSVDWRLMRHLTIFLVAFLFWFAGGQSTYGDPGSQAQATEAAQVPLFPNLGTLHSSITTNVPLAQKYFDQGLWLYYA